jgi:hypothetical protein
LGEGKVGRAVENGEAMDGEESRSDASGGCLKASLGLPARGHPSVSPAESY